MLATGVSGDCLAGGYFVFFPIISIVLLALWDMAR